jgi:hypothetical protein
MRQEIVVDVTPGATIQVMVNNRPAEQTISVPEGTKSVTVIVLDTDKLATTRAARKEKVQVRRAERLNRRRSLEAKRLGIAKPGKGARTPRR